MAMSIIPHFPHTHTYIYIYPPRPDLERDCTRPGQGLYVCLSNLQAIVTLLQFSDSPLPTPFFFHQNPSPPHLQLRFCSSLFFAAPTSSSFTPPPPLCPRLVEATWEKSLCIPFPRADSACPLFSTSGFRLDAKIIYVFLPSTLPPLPWVRTSDVQCMETTGQGFSRLGFQGDELRRGGIRVSGSGGWIILEAAVCRFCERGQTWSGVWFRNGGNRVNAMRCRKWRKVASEWIIERQAGMFLGGRDFYPDRRGRY